MLTFARRLLSQITAEYFNLNCNFQYGEKERDTAGSAVSIFSIICPNKWRIYFLGFIPKINGCMTSNWFFFSIFRFLHPSIKAGIHWPENSTSKIFGKTQTSSGTNLFGVLSCVGSFWNCTDGVWSDSTRKVWECWRSEDWTPLDTLIGCVPAVQWPFWLRVC